MASSGLPATIAGAARRVMRLVARPVRRDRGRGGVVIQPYRGYGSPREVFLMGRVFRQPSLGWRLRTGAVARDLVDTIRRLLRRGVGRAAMKVRVGTTEQQVTTDADGYFRARVEPAQRLAADQLWHPVELELIQPTDGASRARGTVFVPPEQARFVVISDIDDTVVYTGVANKLLMMWRLFAQGATSRVAFAGVAALYRALHRGVTGQELNPMLYVSRGPWSLYEVLDEFFHLHDIPVGPILFLRDWGLSLWRPLPRLARDHKLHLIQGMLALYRDLPFVLIGDSGQSDPEIYTQVVRAHPGRVLAIYIRNVSRSPHRRQAIETLAMEVAKAGSSLLLAADSFAMAEHAVQHGLISPDALAAVLRERTEQQGQADLRPTRRVEQPTAPQTRAAVEQGQLNEKLEQETADGSPPNVVVEPTEEPSRRPARE